MTRGQLNQAVAMVGGALRGQGIRQQDAVAMVMPNGPEMAVLFTAVACWAIAAPLNAAYREDEFDFYLGDLDAKAIIV
jgi:acyl-coenzyme A synthetase/AMP-(fatty) acid ligase